MAGPLRLLVVEDDPDDARTMFRVLRASGRFEPVHARTGSEGLEAARAGPFAACLVDYRLPDMSGIECTAKLKTILPKLPIIILTGFPDGRNFFRSLMAGARGFLVKPVAAQEFLDAINEVLDGGIALAKPVVPYLVQLVHQIRQVSQENHLTRREEEILSCLFEGMQDKEIASTLGIGTATVHTHMHRLFDKLDVHSRQDIIGKFLAID
jgi:DNA-binding NarL/FixJ family response regulator